MSEKIDTNVLAKGFVCGVCILCGTYLLANEVEGAFWLFGLAALVLL